MKMTAAVAMAAAATVAVLACASTANAGDAKAGQNEFIRCAACHTRGKGDPNGIGPNLFGVVGRKAGSKADFSYSDVLKKAGFVWTPQKLDQWIANPQKMLPGTRMVFAGLPDAKDRADVIAYLATLK